MQCIFKNKKQIQTHTNTPSITRFGIYIVCFFVFIFVFYLISTNPIDSKSRMDDSTALHSLQKWTLSFCQFLDQWKSLPQNSNETLSATTPL